MITSKQAFKDLRDLKMSVKRTEAGDYRVNNKGRPEDAAYYTGDLTDLHRTGHTMAGAKDLYDNKYGQGHDMAKHGEGKTYGDK